MTNGDRLTLNRVGTDRIVRLDGEPGIFTPLVGPDKGDVKATANLEEVIDVLRAQLAALQSENARLAAKITELSAPPRSSDDLAAGLQHSLDALQERLAGMANQTSDFAVREFSLESKVHVDVTPLGTIGFSFVQPGEEVNAAALSTMSITVVPVPKPTGDVPLVADVGVEAIEGLTPEQVSALRAAHITTAGTFRTVATRATTTATLQSLLGVDRDALGRYTVLAGLLTVPGIDGLTAAVLYDAGITDAATLAAQDPGDLLARYGTAAKPRKAPLPDLDRVEGWVEAARRIADPPVPQ